MGAPGSWWLALFLFFLFSSGDLFFNPYAIEFPLAPYLNILIYFTHKIIKKKKYIDLHHKPRELKVYNVDAEVVIISIVKQ